MGPVRISTVLFALNKLVKYHCTHFIVLAGFILLQLINLKDLQFLIILVG